MQDGSTDTKQDTLPGETTQGQSSDGEGRTSAQETPVYTKAELDKALADSGRKRKAEMESLQARVKASEELITQLRKEKDDAEEEKYKGNPSEHEIWKRQKAIREREARLAQTEAELKKQQEELATDIEEVKFNRNLKVAKSIAANYKDIDPEELVSFTDGSKEKMEAMAKKYGKPKEEKPPEAKVSSVTVDSNKTLGGTGDKAFLARYARGEDGDHERAGKLLSNLGK